jgi:DNA-binding MarR family transcriptional regulator
MERPLRESEMLVIFHLMQDATLTDAALARRSSMKESTVSSIRRRLMDSRHIYFSNVPSFHKLGCALFVQLFGSTNPAVPRDIKDSAHLRFLDQTPEVFDSASGEGFIMMSGVVKDFSDYLIALDRYEKAFSGPSASERADLRAAFYPLGISRVCYTYNFAPGLHRIFGLDVPTPTPRRPVRQQAECVPLSPVEKRTLVNLVEYPHATDAQIALLMGRSRQTVTNVRKRLERKGMYTRSCIIPLVLWNIELIAYVHIRFKPDIDPAVRTSLSGLDWVNMSWYTLERDTEAHATYMFKDYRDYLTEMQRMMKPLMESGALKGDPSISLVSTAATKELRDGHYGPMVRKLVGLGDELPRSAYSMEGV